MTRRVRIYEIQDEYTGSGSGSAYFATLAEAREAARAASLEHGYPVEVNCFFVDLTKPMAVAMLNQEGYAEELHVAERWERVTCGACEACEYGGGHGCPATKVRRV